MKTALLALLLLSVTSTAYAVDLYKPDGPGPFPAVVLLHGCGGINSFNHDYAQQLKEQGFVAKVVDSFGPRGLDVICTNNALMSQMARKDRIDDAFTALNELRSLPYVDPERIGLMGWSHGAGTSLIANVIDRDGPRFKAVVSIYPYCSERFIGQPMKAPTLILIGEWDDWTPADKCQALAKTDTSITLKVFPSTYHKYDDPEFLRSQIYLTHKLEYKPSAAKETRTLTIDFFTKHLR